MAINTTSADAIQQRRIFDAIPTIIRDPRTVQRLMVNTVQSLTNGEVRIIDPTSPFVLMMEMTAQLAAASVSENDALHRRQYASAATDIEDIYYHVADVDMLGIYAQPAMGTIIVLLNADTIRARAVATSNPDIRKIIIPKHTEFQVGDYKFTMQYPVEITVMNHGGITIRYNTAQTSPLYNASTAPINSITYTREGREWIGINIPVKQMAIARRVIDVNAATGASRKFQFTDNFFYCRAYHKNESETTWTEIGVVLNKEIYDPRKPSVAIRVLSSEVEVNIPLVYITNGLIRDSVRLDIYTTKGPLELDLSTYDTSAFSANFTDNDSSVVSVYSKVLDNFDGIAVSAQKVVTGGASPMTLGELRNRTTRMSASDYGYAITPDQVETLLNTNGYDLVSNIDDITNRQFLATRLLPAPVSKTLDETIGGTNQELQAQNAQLTVTGIGSDVRLLSTTVNALELNRHVYVNNRRTTITPRVLYRVQQDLLSIVDSAEVDDILTIGETRPETVANLVTNANYLYTPFYTVLDIQSDDFTTRVYNLDTPAVTSSYTHLANEASLIGLECTGYQILAVPGAGYQLRVRFQGDSVFKALTSDRLSIQLTVADGTNRTWWNGILETPVNDDGTLTTDPIWLFNIDTDYDVDPDDRLIVSASKVPVDLTTTFQCVVVVKDHMPDGATYTEIDDIVNVGMLPNYVAGSKYLGIINESLDIHLGDALTHLWRLNRSVVDPDTYKRYEQDVLAYYETTEYKRDINNRIEFTIDPTTSKPVPVVLHVKGDPVLDEDGQQVIRFHKGDVMIGEDGKPEIKGGERAILRHIDMTLFDGRYYFATDPLTLAYLNDVMSRLVAWVTVDIPNIKQQLIDRSLLYFHPKTTTGKMTVITGENETATVNADQILTVTYYVSKANYDNAELRKYITEYTPRILKEAIEHRTVSVDSIVDAVREALGDDILSVTIRGFVDDMFQIVTLTDDSMLPSIGKRLVALPSKELRVEDAITVDILKHIDSLSI